jgi:aryl-alcohol dehydrogenase-like predicted oxidoreductase
VIGARTRKQLQDVLGALDRPLSIAEVAAVEALLPKDAIEGSRYPTAHMKHLDSER